MRLEVRTGHGHARTRRLQPDLRHLQLADPDAMGEQPRRRLRQSSGWQVLPPVTKSLARTGLGIGEGIAIKWSDLEGNVLHVQPRLYQRKGRQLEEFIVRTPSAAF